MRYVIDLEKTIKKTIVIDAKNDDEAHEKALIGDTVHEYTNVSTTDTYMGYQYVGDRRYNDDETLICTHEELADYLGTTVNDLERDVYKYTDSGLTLTRNTYGITLTGCVEGSDAEPNTVLAFPFSGEQYDNAVQYLEDDVDRLWHEANDDEGEESDEQPESD